MRQVFGVIITDEMEEAMLDAIDLYGVYAYRRYNNVPGVIFVVMLEEDAVGQCRADEYLRERVPEWCWVVVAEDWLNRDNMESAPLFMNGGWFEV